MDNNQFADLLISGVEEITLVLDADEVIVELNATGRAVLGADIVGLPITDLLPQVPPWGTCADIALHGRYYEVRAQDQDEHRIVWLHDVTRHQQRVEQSELHCQQEIVLADALRDITIALNGTLDVREVLMRILENVGRVVPHDSANIMLIDHERGIASIVEARGYEKMGAEAWIKDVQLPFGEKDYYIRDVIRDKRPLALADTAADERWRLVSSSLQLDRCMPVRRFAGAIR